MSDLPTPTAARLKQPSWRDARLVIGLLLVLAATVLGSVVVANADDRVPMYAAAGPLVPGQRLEADDLVRVDVQLAAQSQRYLSAAQALPPDQHVLREVRQGELVPTSAVGSKAEAEVQPLTLMVASGDAAPLLVGSQVDVYVNAVVKGGKAAGVSAEYSGPELSLEGVTVSSLPKSGSTLGGGGAGDQPVQVMAPTGKIREIIGQVDDGARVTLVPVAGTVLKVDS